MPLAFNLYEEFKEDGFKIDGEEKEPSDARVPLSSYARRLRRKVIDIAGKLVCTASQTIFKVNEATARRIRIEELFEQVTNPPRFERI